MKRNNVAKRFGIASLCLATALSAFSGIASQKNNVALAEGTVAVEDFVHTTAGTVAQTSERTTTKNTTTTPGLRLSSDAAYEGTFKTVFSGDTTLTFKFPEGTITTGTSYSESYFGDFKIRIADVDDDTNYFEIWYVASYNSKTTRPYTNIYLKHNGQTRTSKYDGSSWYTNQQDNNNYRAGFPTFRSFLSNGKQGAMLGVLNLDWSDDGVLSVKKLGCTQNSTTGTQTVLAAFDDSNKFTSGTSWGLPLLENFKDGYTISFSSNVTKDIAGTSVTDNGTDVFFTSIKTNDGATTYNFSESTIAVDAGMTKFNDTFATEAPTTEAGEVFLGWKGADGLYAGPSGAMAHKLCRKSDAVVIGYDTIDGASVRLDTTGNTSGIRFMTTFDKDEYAAVEQYITEKGTLVAVTSALNAENDFTIANYQDMIEANGKVQKVVNTKGVFDYTAANGTTYTAYSMAITFENVEEASLASYYTTSYSARGYLVVTYADGSTATIYTDYDADKNSRSIAQTAYNIQQANTEYASYDGDQKTIVDTYAGCYNANQQ